MSEKANQWSEVCLIKTHLSFQQTPLFHSPPNLWLLQCRNHSSQTKHYHSLKTGTEYTKQLLKGFHWLRLRDTSRQGTKDLTSLSFGMFPLTVLERLQLCDKGMVLLTMVSDTLINDPTPLSFPPPWIALWRLEWECTIAPHREYFADTKTKEKIIQNKGAFVMTLCLQQWEFLFARRPFITFE